MTEAYLGRIRNAIRGESLDGWLFSNFRHRDRLSDELLDLPSDSVTSRPWVYAVPAEGTPVRIVHAIESGALNSLPGEKKVYAGRGEYLSALGLLAGKEWGAHLSADLPIVSFLDEGSADTFRSAGLRLRSAASLIQRMKGLLDDEGIAGHERAAAGLYAIVAETWAFVDGAFRSGAPLREGDVRSLMLHAMASRSLETDHPPIVAAGKNAGDPHYDFSGQGAPIRRGDVVQLDLWAKEKGRGSAYADISWVGVFAERESERQRKAFGDLIAARDLAVAYIRRALASGRRPSGASVDEAVRSALIAAGYADALRHRTGHGIDTECHGSGANIDSFEFPDPRLLLDGSCFSIEPGIYFDDFGLRTEIDVYLRAGEAIVSGGRIQTEFLRCGGVVV